MLTNSVNSEQRMKEVGNYISSRAVVEMRSLRISNLKTALQFGSADPPMTIPPGHEQELMSGGGVGLRISLVEVAPRGGVIPVDEVA